MRRDTANSRTNFSGPPECAVHVDPTTITSIEIHPRHLYKLKREIDDPHDERNPKMKTRPKRGSEGYWAISQRHEDIYKLQRPRITSPAHQENADPVRIERITNQRRARQILRAKSCATKNADKQIKRANNMLI